MLDLADSNSAWVDDASREGGWRRERQCKTVDAVSRSKTLGNTHSDGRQDAYQEIEESLNQEVSQEHDVNIDTTVGAFCRWYDTPPIRWYDILPILPILFLTLFNISTLALALF